MSRASGDSMWPTAISRGWSCKSPLLSPVGGDIIPAQDAAPDGALKSALSSFPTACAVDHRMTPAKAGFAVVPGPYFNASGRKG